MNSDMPSENITNKSSFSSCKTCLIVIGVLVMLLVVASFAIGVLSTRLYYGQGGTNNDIATPPVDQKAESLRLAKANLEFIRTEDHLYGNRNAEISIIEYSDFECPFCQSFHPTVKQAVDKNSEKVNWLYRHFPLDNIHPLAIPMAEASECVADQLANEGFWAFAELLVSSKPTTQDAVKALAIQVGVDEAQYDECISTEKFSQLVLDERQKGIDAGVVGTPGTYIVNNKTKEIIVVEGAEPFANIQKYIDSL